MTLCNMSIEGGARAGMVAPDDKTIAYLQGRPMSPKGDLWTQARKAWRISPPIRRPRYDAAVKLRAETIAPQVTWGTSPGMVTGVDGQVPDPSTNDR